MLWKRSPVQNLSAFVRMSKLKDIFPIPVFGLQWKGSEIGWKWNEGESDQEGLKTKQLKVKGSIEVDQDDNVFGKWRKCRDRGALFELKGFSRLYPFTREGSRNKE